MKFNRVLWVVVVIMLLILVLTAMVKNAKAAPYLQEFPTATAIVTDTPGTEPTLPPPPPTRTPRPSPTVTPAPTSTPTPWSMPTNVVLFVRDADTLALVWNQNSNANYVLVYVNGVVADYNDHAVPGHHKVVTTAHAGESVSILEYLVNSGTVTGPFRSGPYIVPSLVPSAPTTVRIVNSSTYNNVVRMTWVQTSEANRVTILKNGVAVMTFPSGKGSRNV